MGNFLKKNKKIAVILSFAFLVLLAAMVVRKARAPEEIADTTRQSLTETTSKENCKLTQPDGQGPYYQTGSPTRTNIAPPQAEGEKLTIKGHVLNQKCEPVANTELDIWHADANGNYDDEWYRGKVKADENGKYEFETIFPSGYGSETNRRPAHIHYKVWIEGVEVLTSQMYFDQELLDQVGETRLVEISNSNGGWLGSFDIVINSNQE